MTLSEAANVVVGVGFLGAGMIMKRRSGEVANLTTAASIWTTAAIATAAGLGREATAIVATILAIVILALLLRLERHVARRRGAADDPARRGEQDRDAR